ncbi:MAG: 3-deoxy-7-phosphoheptulonate synthase [Gammaproteobacteria bacterium]|nr:3-deoxy-7-phosphoheptulonate synthase [Gammaproteobacteria bacterium]
MWTPESWQNFTIEQQPDYPDAVELEKAITELSGLPPLVSAAEVSMLKQHLAEASGGKVFILQGGDCAESFANCSQTSINRKLSTLLQMSLLLSLNIGKPVIRVGRMAGQYAKPRSSHTETVNGVSLPSYRGDLINGHKFDADSRRPNPSRLLKGYSFASLTLNYIRAHSNEHLANFCRPEAWDKEHLLHESAPNSYRKAMREAQKAFQLMKQLEPDATKLISNFYTCHEALHLNYEQALTRNVEDRWFNLSTHLPWVGMRTAKPDSAHIEYLRGIENPIAIKVGPRMSPDWLSKIIVKLNPENEPGRITLITRLGCSKVKELLPQLIKTTQENNFTVTWICDPMHGNTMTTQDGFKTRYFEHIVDELLLSRDIHAAEGSVLGGVHLELTGEHVTECVGGHGKVREEQLRQQYQSLVDPRLNLHQALELAMLYSKKNSSSISKAKSTPLNKVK